MCLCICLSVCMSQNFGARWRLQKLSDLAEIWHTYSLSEYLGVFFSFFKNSDFWGLGTSFSQLLQLDLQIVGKILKLSPVRCARSTIYQVGLITCTFNWFLFKLLPSYPHIKLNCIMFSILRVVHLAVHKIESLF